MASICDSSNILVVVSTAPDLMRREAKYPDKLKMRFLQAVAIVLSKSSRLTTQSLPVQKQIQIRHTGPSSAVILGQLLQ